MTQRRLVYKNGAFMRGDARLLVMVRGQWGDGAPSHKEVEDAGKEIAAAVHDFDDMLASLAALIPLASEAIDARKASDNPEDNDADLIALYKADIKAARAAIAKANGEVA
jgi:hypothetical protein